MSKARSVLLSIAAAALAAGAGAQEQSPYIGFDIGAGRSNDSEAYCKGRPLGPIDGCDQESTFLRFRGGFEFSEHVAGELFYTEANDMAVEQDLYANQDSTLRGEYHMQFTGAALKLTLPSESINAFVRFGFHNWKREGLAVSPDPQSADIEQPRVDFAGSGTNFTYGFGAEYKLAPNMRVVGSYDNHKTADLDIAGAAVGLSYHF